MHPRISSSSAERIAHAATLIRNGLIKAETRRCIGTGVDEIDVALPWGGFPRGLHEVASPVGDGARAGFIASLLGRGSGPILWCRSRRTALDIGDPYGPGLAGLGLDPARLVLVEAGKRTDLLWAMEEGARTKGLAAIVAEGVMPDLTASRRLQLAAEAGDVLVFLLQSGRQAAASSALTRWFVVSVPSVAEADGPGRARWRIALWRCRGGGRPQDWIVEWDDASLSLSMVPPLADRLLAAAR
jgi:protein ImuA